MAPWLSFPVVRVAAVQATPVILDLEAQRRQGDRSDRRRGRTGRAAGRVPRDVPVALPVLRLGSLPSSGRQADEFWERFWASSVAVDGPEVDAPRREACREHDVHVAIGVNEREDERPGVGLQLPAPPRPRRRPARGTAS